MTVLLEYINAGILYFSCLMLSVTYYCQNNDARLIGGNLQSSAINPCMIVKTIIALLILSTLGSPFGLSCNVNIFIHQKLALWLFTLM